MISKEIGYWGEKQAFDYLLAKGMSLLKKNYSVRGGEIDLIMKDGTCIVFAEVKTRAEDCFGTPLEYINLRKRKRIIKTAIAYLGRDDVEMRFDAVEVVYKSINGKYTVTSVNHIENAFGEGF